MLAVAALHGPLPHVGVIVAALLAAGTLLATHERLRAVAMLAALVLAPVLVLADIWNTSQLRFVHTHPLEAVVAALVALVVLAIVARELRRRPYAFAFLAVLTLPFRIPISVGGETSNLLVPLYFVVAAGALAWLVPVLVRPQVRPQYRSRREEERAREARRHAPVTPGAPHDPPLVVWLARLLALFVVVYAAQATYSGDFTLALQNVAFFYVPFALLYQLLRQTEWTPRLLWACVALLAVLGIAFSLVGFVEYATRTIFLNPKLVVTNDLHDYFTVNSVFFDPDIFGRFLALVMILVSVTLLYRRRGREQLWATIALAVMWACLVLTLSRSSLAALLLGMAVLAALRWRPGRALVGAVAVVVAAAVAIAVTPTTFGFNQGFNGVTSGRGGLVSGGVALFGDRPGWGYGSGSFQTEYRAQHRNVATSLSASHTIPITIAAEQGVIGLIVYAALVVVALLVVVRHARGDPVRSAIAATFVALIFHTLLYADFLEDPSTWALLGVGVAFAVAAQPTAAQRAAERAARASGAGADVAPASP